MCRGIQEIFDTIAKQYKGAGHGHAVLVATIEHALYSSIYVQIQILAEMAEASELERYNAFMSRQPKDPNEWGQAEALLGERLRKLLESKTTRPFFAEAVAELSQVTIW